MTGKSARRQRRAEKKIGKGSHPGIKLVRILRGHAHVVGRIAWSPNGRLLASPSQGTTRLWDTDTGKCLHSLTQTYFAAAAFDPAAQRVAITDADATMLWSPVSGRPIR